MGDRGEDMQQMTTGRDQTRVAAIRTEDVVDGTVLVVVNMLK